MTDQQKHHKRQRFLPTIKHDRQWLIDRENDDRLVGPFASWGHAKAWMKRLADGELVENTSKEG